MTGQTCVHHQMHARGHSSHAIELFPYYDTSGRPTGMAQGGCESQGGSSVEREKRAREPLTTTANLTPDDNVSEVRDLN